jgi:hypothetical protein
MAGPQWPPPRPSRHWQWQMGLFPQQVPPKVGHGHARELGVRASSAARTSPPHARGRGVGRPVKRCSGGGKAEKRGGETDAGVPHVSERK